MCVQVCADIWFGLLFIFRISSCTIAAMLQLCSHKRLFIQMGLSTAETDVSSVPGNNTLLRLQDSAAGQTRSTVEQIQR